MQLRGAKWAPNDGKIINGRFLRCEDMEEDELHLGIYWLFCAQFKMAINWPPQAGLAGNFSLTLDGIAFCLINHPRGPWKLGVGKLIRWEDDRDGYIVWLKRQNKAKSVWTGSIITHYRFVLYTFHNREIQHCMVLHYFALLCCMYEKYALQKSRHKITVARLVIHNCFFSVWNFVNL